MKQLITIILCSLLIVGCASSKSGQVYSRDEAQRVQQVQLGTIEYVKPILIEGTKSAVGTIGGAAIGGIAGSTIGKGRGSAIAAVVGAIAGGLIGSATEEGVTRQQGYEIMVKLDSGEMLSVVQEADEEFTQGERIRVLSDGFKTRISH